MNNVTGGLLRDVLANRMENAAAKSAVSVIRAVQGGVRLGEAVGDDKRVLDLPAEPDSTLLQREQELTAELEAIRERRSAG